ncbi:hypothetical protein [Lignipirellula cremea]|uniref:hypothetical protein n=1 Tax=Lignipirellula cremea TaxID=2528010 RepID=UPI0011A60620|nr:hypothetical protein [Lignipirellula cremea]
MKIRLSADNSPASPAALLLLGALLVMTLSGCRNWMMFQPRVPVGPTIPQVFQAAPTLEEIVGHVNSSSARIQQLTSQPLVTVGGLPATLRANVAIERPHRFRMQAHVTQITGTEMDIGSNDELFWLWVKRQPPPTIYFAHRDRFAQSPARAMLPIEPDWLISALGVATFDPADAHEGPYQRADNQWEIRTRMSGEHTGMTRSTLVDGSYGYVTAQHVYDQRGQLVASAKASKFRHYPEVQVSLPTQVAISLPAANLNIEIETPHYAINQLSGDPARLWSMPREPGVAVVDIAAVPPGALGPPGAPPQNNTPPYSSGPSGGQAPYTTTPLGGPNPYAPPAAGGQNPYSPAQPGAGNSSYPPAYTTGPLGGQQPYSAEPVNSGTPGYAPGAASEGSEAGYPAASPDPYSQPGSYPQPSAAGNGPGEQGGYAPADNNFPRTGFRPNYRGVSNLR